MRACAALLVGIACIACFLPSPLASAMAVILAIIGALIIDRRVLSAALRLGAMLALTLAAVITGAAVAWSAGPGRGIEVGGTLLLRLLVLLLATGLLARSVDAETIVQATRRFRLERLGLVLGLSLNTLPRLVRSVHEVWLAARVRAGTRWQLLRFLPRLAEMVLAHTARIAEEASAAAALRGHAGLTPATVPLAVPPRLVVVTGATNSGKTSTVLAAVDELRSSRTAVLGIAQPGIWEHGKKVGFLIRDLHSAEETVLARRAGDDDGQHGTSFRFTEEGLALASKALSRSGTGGILVVDELGPAELRGHGHMRPVRQALAAPELTAAIIVVRRQLVPFLLAALDAEDAVVIDANEGPQKILEALR